MRTPPRLLLLVAGLTAVCCSGSVESAVSVRKAPEVARKELGDLVDLLVSAASGIRTAEFDSAALAKQIGPDPEAALSWVRDHTWWVPYRGLLRGPRGVMLDRLGSHLDRAVLLGDLLRRTGQTVRLAHVELADDVARSLSARLRPVPDVRLAASSDPVSPSQQKALDAMTGGGEKSIDAQIVAGAKRRDEAAGLTQSIFERVQSTAQGLGTGIGPADRAAMSALKDYWWVERQDRGRWVAMDVLPSDGSRTSPHGMATETYEWPSERDEPAVPANQWHTINVRVIVERYRDGHTGEATALDATLRPADLANRPIEFGHITPNFSGRSEAVKTSDDLRAAALQVRTWIPYLRVGADLISRSAFGDDGEVVAATAQTVENRAARAVETFGDALGGGDDGPASFATAEWLDYDIQTPGEPVQHLRRPVFDLLGPARRAAPSDFDGRAESARLERFEALWSRTDILLQSSSITGAFATDRLVAPIVSNQAALKALSHESDPDKARSQARALVGQIHLPSALTDLAVARSAIGGNQPWYLDRPNILSYRISRSLTDVDRMTARELIDIGANPIAVRRQDADRSFSVRLRQGIADTVAEMFVLGGDPAVADNTAAMFGTAGVDAAPPLLIKPGDVAAAQQLSWTADPLARLTAQIGAGSAAVVLSRPVDRQGRPRVGWWRIDPHTGETIGVMDTGFHQGEAERVIGDLKATIRAMLQEDAAEWEELRQFVIRQGARGGWAPNELWQREALMQILEDLEALGL